MINRIMAALLLSLSLGCANAQTVSDFFPANPDPLMGNYVGRWTGGEDIDPDITAQVIPLGRDKYQVILAAKINMRAPHKAVAEIEAKGGKLIFDADGIEGVCDGQTFNGSRRGGPKKFTMTKQHLVSPSMGKAAPEGAVVLFDGKNLDAWDGTTDWELLPEGVLLATPKSKYIESKQKFKSCELHVEFRTPLMASSRGQSRGNSGVFLQGTYEVQVLDSFGLPGYYDECGALYKVAAPMVNACLPPTEWQTYDITYHAPKFDAEGKLVQFARVTVLHNGVLIHNEQELPQRTEYKEAERLAAHPQEPGPIKFQGHGNYVQYRNVWVKPLAE